MTGTIEKRLIGLGFELQMPEGDGYYGENYGTMKPFHIVDNVLHLSGHVPQKDGRPLYSGRLGEDVTVGQGIEAAQPTALNAIVGMKQALGELDRVAGIIKSLNFIACAPDFTDVHLVSSAMADRLVDVFGRDIGVGCRATIGVQSLADNHCLETWIEVEIQ